MVQLMSLPLTVSCFSKIQIGFSFLVLAHPGSPRQMAVKQVCVSPLMKTFFILQAAQSKKGKAAEKSPAEETAKPIEMAADVKLVKEQIETQGQKVRKMKATGAAKVKQ